MIKLSLFNLYFEITCLCIKDKQIILMSIGSWYNQSETTYHTVRVANVAEVDWDGRGRPQMIPGHCILAPVRRASDLSKVGSAVASSQTARSDRLSSADKREKKHKGWVIGRPALTTDLQQPPLPHSIIIIMRTKTRPTGIILHNSSPQ